MLEDSINLQDLNPSRWERSTLASVIDIGIENSLLVQPAVDTKSTVFYREKAAGMYSALPYAFKQVIMKIISFHQLPPFLLLSQVIIEMLFMFIQSLLCGFIICGTIDVQWTAAKFFWFLFFFFFFFFTTLLYSTYTMYLWP